MPTDAPPLPRDPRDPRGQRAMRLGVGTALCLAVSFGLDMPIPMVAPVLGVRDDLHEARDEANAGRLVVVALRLEAGGRGGQWDLAGDKLVGILTPEEARRLAAALMGMAGTSREGGGA